MRKQKILQEGRKILWRFGELVKLPIFISVSIAGNLAIVGGAVLFHYFEAGSNPNIQSFLDCLVWAVGVVTTVGSSSVAPITVGGKLLSICMMMAGAVFLWTYMGMFVVAVISPEMKHFEREIHELGREIKTHSLE